MQVGYHLNPQDEVDDNAAGQGPSVTVADSAPEQSSFISRSAAAAIAVDGIAKNWAVPLHLTQLHVFITREHTSAGRSIGGILWTLVGICVFVAICMIGATCFVGFTDSGSDPRDGWMRRTTKGSQSQSPPLAKSGVQQQQKQQQQQPLQQQSILQQRSQQKQRSQQSEDKPTASLLLQSAQKLNECQAALRQSQEALQQAGTPTHSSTTPQTGASASRSDSIFARMVPREWSSGETAGPIPDLSSPPILCQSLVLSNAEARFMIPMDSLLHVEIGAAIDITGTSGRKLLQACVLQGSGGSRELHVSSIGCEDDPRAVVVSDTSRSSLLKIFARGGHLFGTLDISDVQGHGRALLTCGGARAMTIEPGNMEELEMVAHAMDGRVLANAGRVAQPLRGPSTPTSCVGSDSWKLQVKPHSDAVLIVACMLSIMMLQQSVYVAPLSSASLDVDTAPSLRGIGKHDL